MRPRLAASPNTSIPLTQSLRADRLRGKRVRLSGWVKVDGVIGAGAGLWFRGDGPNRTLAFDNMDGRRLTGTEDWKHAEIVLDVPEDVIGFAFGALLSGNGMARVDDLRLDIVDTTVAVTAPPIDLLHPEVDSAARILFYDRQGSDPLNMDFEGLVLPEDVVATTTWFRTSSVAFLTDDPEASDADLAPLGALVGSAGLVAMGEGTHGTREFFRMKHRVFSWLVRNRGFTHFGIEASLPEALAVNHYIQTGSGDPAMLVRGLGFWTWSTEEVIELVRWMRQWNAGGSQPRVHFTGFDMQFPGAAIDSVVAFTTSINVALGDSARVAYECLGPYRNLGTKAPEPDAYRALEAEKRDACRASLAGVDSLFANREVAWKVTAGTDRTALMKRLARLVSQWEDRARQATSAATAARDRYMAENVEWWRSQAAGARTMLWAHNAHVRRAAPAMGSHLAARYGSDYLNVALTFSSGNFNAVHQLPTGAIGAIQAHALFNALPSSIEIMFDGTGMSRAIFNTKAITGGPPAAEPLRRRLTIRSVGSTFAPTAPASAYQAALALPEDYDLIIWFQLTTPSRLSFGTSFGNWQE